MRLFFQIIIILFVLFSLFLMRDDLRYLYERAHTILLSSVEQGENISKSNLIDPISDEQILPVMVGHMPEPLRLISNLLADQSVLSVEGVIRLTNEQRKTNGDLPSLTESTDLDSSAELKLKDMFAQQYFEHVSPQGVSVSALGSQVGYEYITIGENLALGNFTDDKALVDAWMASPGHRANILNSHYTEIGVAVGKGVFEGRTVWMAVQHFGLPKNVCPQVNRALNESISLNKKNLSAMSTDLALRRKMINSGVSSGRMVEAIDIYNTLIGKYNALVLDTKKKVSAYNKQVRVFNQCVTMYTS